MASHLGPLEFNPLTKEPFLRLRGHPTIIMTPPRQSDVPFVIPPLNDERVHLWLTTPYPYLTEHAEAWINKIKLDCDSGLKELIDALPRGGPIVLTQSPVRFLREIQNDGSDVLLGDIGLVRCPNILLENPKHDNATNLALPAGNPEIIWVIGDWLVPSHHRRGIMTDAVDTIISNIAKPLLGSQHFIAMVHSDNKASGKVFLRNGFNLAQRIVNCAEVKGILHDLDVFERYDTTETCQPA